MSPPSRTAFRRTNLIAWLTGSDRGRLLAELTLAGILVVSATVLVWFSIDPEFTPPRQVLSWLVLLGIAVGLRALGFFRLVGPVFFFDLLRSSRRLRNFLIRMAYVCFLFFLILWIYATSWDQWRGNVWQWPSVWEVFSPPISHLTRLAGTFFNTFIVTQFVVVVLLTPAYTAGAIAEEKERKTLPFILATDLDDREIVVGKLAARLMNILMFLLAGLPILCGLMMFGGIAPDLLVAASVATVMTVLSLGALSVWNSVVLAKGRDAMIASYAVSAAYLVISGALMGMTSIPGWATFPSAGGWTSPVTFLDVANVSATGNIFVAVIEVESAMGRGTLSAELPELLRNYVLFHGLTAALFTLLAVGRLRAIASHDDVRKEGHRLWTRVFGRPRVGTQPVLWREVFAEAGGRWHVAVRIVVGLLVVLSFVPVGFIVYNLLYNPWSPSSSPADLLEGLSLGMNWWVRIVGTIVASLLLLNVAVRAAGSVGGEREKQTLDSLLTTPLQPSEILFGKLMGCVLGQRWGWVWLGAIYLLGVVTFGINPVALPLILGAWLVLATFCGVLGLFYSTLCRTTLQAILATLVTLILVGGGHWVIWMCCTCPMFFIASQLGPKGSEDLAEMMRWVAQVQGFGLTPPLMLGLLAFRAKDFDWWPGAREPYFLEWLGCAFAGLLAWGFAAGILWTAACNRFAANIRPRARRSRRAPRQE